MSANKKNTSLPSKGVYGRMNFLYQASMLMAKQNNIVLSAFYGRQCQSIGKKAQLRISPDIKRNFCKRCGLGQEPSTTADVEVVPKTRKRKKNQKHGTKKDSENIDHGAEVFIKCRKCKNKRKFVVNPKYKLWLEDSTAFEELRLQTDKKQTGEKEASNLETNIKN